jgi:hypothetical protein
VLLTKSAVEDEAGLWLTLWVKRSPKPEYFVMIPRSDGQWNPHASWHFDGRFHHKIYGHPVAFQQRQRPDASFKGNGNIILTPVTADARVVGAACDRSEFDGVLVIPASILGAGRHVVSVHLVQAGHREVPEPGNRLIDQLVFKESVPSSSRSGSLCIRSVVQVGAENVSPEVRRGLEGFEAQPLEVGLVLREGDGPRAFPKTAFVALQNRVAFCAESQSHASVVRHDLVPAARRTRSFPTASLVDLWPVSRGPRRLDLGSLGPTDGGSFHVEHVAHAGRGPVDGSWAGGRQM